MSIKMPEGQLSYHCYDHSKPVISPQAVAKFHFNCLDRVETIGNGGLLWILPTLSAELMPCYLTVLPPRQVFEQKIHDALALAQARLAGKDQA